MDHSIVSGIDHPLVREALELVNGTSGEVPWASWGQRAPGFAALLRQRYEHLGLGVEVVSLPAQLPRWQVQDNGTVWVAYFGGKDSLAAALLLSGVWVWRALRRREEQPS